MPKKKPPKNAFSFYLDEAMDELRRKGINVRSKQEAVPLVHQKWKDMSKEQKRPYEELAKQWKVMNQGRPRPGRLDCTGNPIENRIDMDRLVMDQRKEQRKYLLDRWQAMRKEQVLDEHFFIISFQSFFEFPDEEGYQPCEVTCIDYSLRTGINREWHAMINPGPIKMGLGAESKIFSEKTHQIPIWGFEPGRTDHHVLWSELLAFVNPTNRKILPPVFSKISELGKNTFCMDYLAQLAGTSNRLSKIFQWECLAMTLYEHAGIQTPSINIIEDGASTSMYDYEANTKCDYHDEVECVYCTLLTVKKCCFWMSDAFTKIYNFEITENHLPVRKMPNYIITHPEDLQIDDANKKRFLGSKSVARYDPNLPLSFQKNVVSDISLSESTSASSTYGARDIRYRPKYQMVDTMLARGRGTVIAGNELPLMCEDRLETLSVVTTDTVDDVGSSILSDSESDATCQADDEGSVVSFESRRREPKTRPACAIQSSMIEDAHSGNSSAQIHHSVGGTSPQNEGSSENNAVGPISVQESQDTFKMVALQAAMDYPVSGEANNDIVPPLGMPKLNIIPQPRGNIAFLGAARGRGRFLAMQNAETSK